MDTKVRGDKQKTQLQMMVEKIPDSALIVMDKCINTSGKGSDYKQTYDFSYMLGLVNGLAHVPALASVRLLEAMLKCKRKACLAHPLCVEFLNCKWRKFGAAIAITNILIYLVFLILLMVMVVFLPAYTRNHLNYKGSLARLIDVLDIANDHNRTHLNGYEKIFYCYGSHNNIRIALTVAVSLCILKEILPMWYTGWRYFKRFSNITELAVYVMAIIFLDPLEFSFQDLDIPLDACPKDMWRVAAITTFLGWIVLLLNFQRLPHMGIYIGMVISMVKTTMQFVIVVSLFVIGFGLAFFMLLGNEPAFRTGGLSVIRTVLMTVGDLNYENILPTFLSQKSGNLSHYSHQLMTTYGHFLIIQRLNLSHVASADDDHIDDDHHTDVLFSSLAYVMFVIFCLLMPIVVLNTLIGLAVGDIETSRKNAAFKQIHIQMELLVQLETALPPWFLSLIQVTYSQQSSAEGIKHWIHRATMAADVPDQEGKSPSALQLVEINNNIHMLNEWLTNLEFNMQQHLSLLKTLAECVKRQQTLTRPIVSKLQSVSDKGDVESETDLVEEPSAPLSDEEDAV
jgi:transient receptor potential cation channel subfamily A protein 1